jgi:hypothetical protein
MGNWPKVSLTAATAVNRKICHEKISVAAGGMVGAFRITGGLRRSRGEKDDSRIPRLCATIQPSPDSPSDRCWNLS